MTKIKVIGVGGSGGNAISRMMKCNIKGVELIALNTDAQDLKKTRAHLKIQIGKKITQGLGTGMDLEIGKQAALENREEVSEILKDTDMVFIAYGAGGGTGTGAGPMIAEIAKNSGALTVAVVTKPFSFEGACRRKIAEQGLKKLKEKVDSLLVIQNDKLLEILEPKIAISNAFWICDDILQSAVRGISDLIVLPGIINVDFADVKAIMKDSGTTLFGIGKAKGEKRMETAVRLALNSPLLDISCRGAKGVLFNISGNKVSLSEIEETAKIIAQEVNPSFSKDQSLNVLTNQTAGQAKIIFGAIQDEKLKKGEIKVTVIATGF